MPAAGEWNPGDDMVRYLLGLLPAETTHRLDEQSIVDAGVARLLRAVESDLVDSYVRGDLDGDILTRFERVYFRSEHRRQKVRFAGLLLHAVERLARGQRDHVRED